MHVYEPRREEEIPQLLTSLLLCWKKREGIAWVGSLAVVGIGVVLILVLLQVSTVPVWLGIATLVALLLGRLLIGQYIFPILEQELREDIQVWLAERRDRWGTLKKSRPEIAQQIIVLLGAEEKWAKYI